MKQIRAALLRLAGTLRLTRTDTDIDEELRSHRTMLADEYRRATREIEKRYRVR